MSNQSSKSTTPQPQDLLSAGERRELARLYKAAQFKETVSYASTLSRRYPQSGVVWNILAASLAALGQDNFLALQRAAEFLPDDGDAHFRFGKALRGRGRIEAAIASYRRALKIKPDYAEIHNDLGNALHDMDLTIAAVACYQEATRIKPDFAGAYNNMGNAQRDLGRFEDAVVSFQQAAKLRPDLPGVFSNLGNAYSDLGRYAEAEACQRRALTIDPGFKLAQSNLLFALTYTQRPVVDQLAEARHFGQMVAALATKPFTFWRCDPRPARLRIGFVSGDFRNHAVGHFLESFLANFDATRFELIAYPTNHKSDQATERMKPRFLVWHPVAGMNDEAAAQLIHADGVHVLIDLAGHSGANRLSLFAWKPAPVQVSWLGFWASTGVGAIDYFIADPWTVPPANDGHFTETVWRLPETRLCFTQPEFVVPVSELPALKSKQVTFGCFNTLTKVNDAVLALWARILLAVPASRLLFKAKQLDEASARQDLVERFARFGIAADRLVLERPEPRQDYLAAYHRVDISLDPFPFSGGTTTVESLWMGVPVLTLAGDRLVSRQGVGLMMNAGLADWVARDADDYLARAVTHASDLPRLAKLRRGLRQQVLASPVFDGPRFSRYIETALWQMWQNHVVQRLNSESAGPTSTDSVEKRIQPKANKRMRSPSPVKQLPKVQADELLGLMQSGRHLELEQMAQTLLRDYPSAGFVWKVLAASRQARNIPAISAFERAAQLLPRDAHAQCLLGSAEKRLGRLEAAEACYRRALTIDPDYAAAHGNLGALFLERGQLVEAEASCRRAVDLAPELAGAHTNLGNVLRHRRQFSEALDSYRRALTIDPNQAEAHCNLGVMQRALGQREEALASFRHAVSINDRSAEMHNSLGNVLKDLGQIDAAVSSYQRALEINPNYAEAHSNLGTALQNLSQSEAAEASFRRALALKPDYAEAHSNLLFSMNFNENLTPEQLFAEHLAYAERYEPSAAARRRPHTNTRDPVRRVCVGFVSGDLRDHAVASFIEPVWAIVDRAQFELRVYSNHVHEDAVTARLKALVPAWRNVAGWTDDELAEQICRDQVDILVDLSGHTAHNRLLTFARKPAPVQVTWIGYPNTTGLQAIDYVVIGRFVSPYGLFEHYYSEKFARIPVGSSFMPAPDAPPVNALPALRRGYVTFGSFNSTRKLGSQVVATWSRVLQAVPDAKMLLGNVSDSHQAQELRERFAQHGIAPERLRFEPHMALQRYLALHHEVDLILDTWPYTGGTTTNHALWMGVPVVTLRGPSRVHCQSAGVLQATSLGDWVAKDVDEFVAVATRWAYAVPALANLRAGMRQRWQASPYRRPDNAARGVELAWRTMWQRWCAGLPAEAFEITEMAAFGDRELQ